MFAISTIKAGNTMQVMKIRFGTGGDRVDAFGMRFYGDIDGEGKQLGRVSEIFSDSDNSPVISNKRVTLWFTFEKIRAYENASAILDDLVAQLRAGGYEIVFSSIDDLVDTTSPAYKGTPESRFPDSRRIHGCNATGGFSVTAEKRDDNPKVSLEEIETIQELARKIGKTVYGKSLRKST
jgi:hypothetical protein